MQIKRLKVSGFKSFVEPAELRIEPGLTGVVGPNGCGKSNVLEAIRWVMGESSPKSMRGSGMEDVIFAATAQRPSRDFAEVSLLIEREPGEEAGDIGVGIGEVEVTRRIERGVGSAYRLNGKDVRAKDVALLFADAATGAHSPALVSQNRIGAIIAAKPTERRQMLEEAAGISGLHVRRKDAEQKLRAAEANLGRLDELLGDMEQRAQALKRQARAAERYRRISDQIQVAEARLIFARWNEAAASADAARIEAERSVGLVQAAAQAQRDLAEVQTEAAKVVADRRSTSQAAREKAIALGHKLATLRSERDLASRRVSELSQRHVSLTADRERELRLVADANEALERLDQEMKALAARMAAAEASRSTIDIRTVEIEDKAREAETALGRARTEQAAEQAEARVARAALESAEGRLSRAEAEFARLRQQLSELGDEGPLVEARRAARRKREEAEAKLASAGEALRDAETRREAASAAREASESQVASARATLAALRSEAEALRKAVETRKGDRALDQIRASPGYERALAAALGDDLEASVGGQGSRRWSGTPFGKTDPALPAGCVSLADHVDAPDELGRRLAQIAVMDCDDGSVELAVGQRLVTREGVLRRWDGYVATDLGAAAAERLLRINRLAVIEDALGPAEEAVTIAEERAQAARQEIEAARQAAEASRAAETDAGAIIREAGREEDAANAAIERLEIKRTGLSERLEQMEADLAEARASSEAARDGVGNLPDAAATEARVTGLREAAEQAQRALAEVRAEAATHARSIGADRARSDAALKESGEWRRRAEEASRRQVEIAERLEEAAQEAQSLADAPDRLAREAEELEDEARKAAEAAEAAYAYERQAQDALTEQERKLAAAGEALSVAREARAGAVARHENLEARRVEITKLSGERFECPPPLLPQKMAFEEADVADAERENIELNRLTAERERIGPVNLVAERELAELEDGRLSSQAEREELGLAINRLRGSIGSLNREGRLRLLSAFETVDQHFRSLFTTLFEGGQAHLELIDSDDPLEAGLEILAQPPGKKLSALTLLSGGEQALTAVALIFALFLTNPAPICVLDEVDAPLDDANIERFCDLLDRMAAETATRYLIVTHNAVTMSRMHRLFGVTMIERGVSRLVSVDLGGAEKLLAAE